ncbi:hypothetical protein [Celeribacter sp.]|uniref:hypothetical protein n=1 Tax=Celeribacter sp. TaxID=1890673 RepID=UPI003A908E7B
MIITMHIGAHCTAGGNLMRGLLKNKGVLGEHGVVVPGPARYREILPDVMKKVKGDPASPATQEMIIDQITETEKCDRLVLSYEDVICVASNVFEGGSLYGKARFKLPWLRNVFAGHEMEFVFGIRNPAGFIPHAFAECGPRKSYEDFIAGVDLHHLRWSHVITVMRDVCPDVPIKVYAFEDSALSWERILRDVAGVRAGVPLAGGLDMLAPIMQREGMARLRAYLSTHKPKNDNQRHRILMAFLDKYANPDEMVEEVDLPGWDADLVADLTERYEDDLYLIEGMEGVTVIS